MIFALRVMHIATLPLWIVSMCLSVFRQRFSYVVVDGKVFARVLYSVIKVL